MFVGYFVTKCTLRIVCAVSLLMLMTWHYKHLTNCRQHAHIEIIYVCERAERARKIVAYQHLKPAISFIIFVGTSFLFCRYNMTFNLEILGDYITGHPPPTYNIGGIYPPPPPPPDRHPCVCVFTHFLFFWPADWGGGGEGHVPPPPPPP